MKLKFIGYFVNYNLFTYSKNKFKNLSYIQAKYN